MAMNQAVIFTKPVHHLGIDLTPQQLAERTREFLSESGFTITYRKSVTGPELAEREIIRQHYLMYSKASYGDIGITDAGKRKFTDNFGKEWEAEFEAGRIMGNPQLLETRRINAHQLFSLWAASSVSKVQAGLLMGRLESLDCYCINAFYPAMEANFNHADTIMDYYVVEFDPAQVSWQQFRRDVLGVTNAAKSVPDSFRGQLYASYKVDFPGRDNFVHGSAGPLEGLVERCIHEQDFDLGSNPIGRHLQTLGVTLAGFREWKDRQSIADLGAIFDTTEEKNTDEIIPILDAVAW